VLGLSAKQRAFVAALAATGGNATEAARRAGYKGGSKQLAVVASKMRKNPKIAAALRGQASAPVARAAPIAAVVAAASSGPAVVAAASSVPAVVVDEDAPALPAGVLTLAERMCVLSELAASDTVDPKDRIRAVEVLTKLAGDGVQVSAGPSTSAQIVVWVGNGRGPVPS
jgi:phage terminase small subunit